jgi:hypothetical protein
MTVAFNGGASLALYELAKGMAMNTSFVLAGCEFSGVLTLLILIIV